MQELIQQQQQKIDNRKFESVINNESKLHPTFEVGDVSYQGDLIIIGIEKLPKSAKVRTNRQLVEGTTKGSRHVCINGNVFDCNKKEVQQLIQKATQIFIDEKYIGPVFVSPEKPTADDIDHPEHGNQGFPAHTICAIAYQRSLDAEQREQRTQD